MVHREVSQIFTEDLDRFFITFLLGAATPSRANPNRSEKNASRRSERLIAKIATILISVAAVAFVTGVMLVPLLINPPHALILLNKTAVLTDQDYEVEYPLNLTGGEKIDIKVSGDGQPIGFKIMDNQSSTLIEKYNDTFYDIPWTVPSEGTYTFFMSAYAGDIKASIIVSKR
jgi:hypothetical protein